MYSTDVHQYTYILSNPMNVMGSHQIERDFWRVHPYVYTIQYKNHKSSKHNYFIVAKVS
jgi:hypothetical protein